MNLKIEEYEEDFEEKVKKRIKDLKSNEKEQDESGDDEEAPNNYEKLIQKLEADVRSHISVEQQLKLYVESYQQKLEEEENLNDKYEADIDRMKDELKERKTEI